MVRKENNLARTPQDIERKYNLAQLVKDVKDLAEEVKVLKNEIKEMKETTSE